jgi:hypothetical protein
MKGNRTKTIGALAGAGILAASLVAVPPDASSVRAENRAVQLASSALPSVFAWPGLQKTDQRQIGDQARALASLAAAVKRGGQENITTAATNRLTFDSAINPMTTNQIVDNAALGSALGLVGVIPAVVLSAGLLGFFFGVLIPLGYVYGWIGYNIIDPILGVPSEFAVSSAAVDEQQTLATDSSIMSTQASARTLEGTTGNALASAATSPNLIDNLLPIVGPAILVGAIAVGLFVLAPAIVAYDLIAPAIGLPTFTEWQLSTAAKSDTRVAPMAATTFAIDDPEKNAAPDETLTKKAHEEDLDKGSGATAPPAAPNDSQTPTGSTSEELTNEQLSTEQEPTSGDPSEQTKTIHASTTHRPVLRGILDVAERVHEFLHPGKRSESGSPAAATETSPQTSPTTNEDHKGDGSPGGSADGS